MPHGKICFVNKLAVGLAAAWFAWSTPFLQAFDLSEIDGDSVAGNAPILLGWEPHRFPLVFELDPKPPQGFTPERFQQIVDAAFESWHTAALGAVQFRSAPFRKEVLTPQDLDETLGPTDCDNSGNCVHVVATVDSNWSQFSGSAAEVIGLTLVKFDPNARRILDSDILLNDDRYDFGEAGETTKFDLQGILAHEVGHVLGISHPVVETRANSTMWSVTPPGNQELRSLEADDIAAVRYLYTPLSLEVPDPDSNLFGLLPRSPAAASGGGGCQTGPDGLGFFGLAWLIPLAIRLGKRA